MPEWVDDKCTFFLNKQVDRKILFLNLKYFLESHHSMRDKNLRNVYDLDSTLLTH